MWSPIDLLFLVWHFNFTPCEEARLNVREIILQKENKTISESVTLRNEN